MKKYNTSPISGMQELLPNLQLEFDHLKHGIARAFRSHGFQTIETPTIERTDILLAKAGGDTEKQIYKVVKTAESASDADQALRFDHTVPLARYVVEHMNDLAFPFKVSQIGRNFRGERAQKGRFREFYQCDVDVIGWQSLPLAYDAEVIATLVDAIRVFPIRHFLVRVSNRKLLSGLLSSLGLQAQSSEIFNITDHAEKVPPEATTSALAALGLTDVQVSCLSDFIKISGPRTEVVPQLRAFPCSDPAFQQGIDELDEVLTLLSPKSDDTFQIVADMLIVRGLDYYTGTVFETVAPDYRSIGSICSGGRYENLAQHYTDQPLPGVGGSIGLTRLFSVLTDQHLVQASATKPVDICIIPIAPSEYSTAEKVAAQLRAQQQVTDIIFTDKKLGDKIKYASKISQHVLIIGEDEVKTGRFTIKDLDSGETNQLVLDINS